MVCKSSKLKRVNGGEGNVECENASLGTSFFCLTPSVVQFSVFTILVVIIDWSEAICHHVDFVQIGP